MTTTDILHELRNPLNFVRVEWCSPETVPADVRERIREEAETYRKQVTEEEIEESMEWIQEAETPINAASWFLDMAADHEVYETICVSLSRIGE